MTLREEIYQEVHRWGEIEPDELVDNIISKIEKRIDEIKDKALRKEGIIKVSDKENTKFQIGYAKGVLIMRVSIKEMLK